MLMSAGVVRLLQRWVVTHRRIQTPNTGIKATDVVIDTETMILLFLQPLVTATAIDFFQRPFIPLYTACSLEFHFNAFCTVLLVLVIMLLFNACSNVSLTVADVAGIVAAAGVSLDNISGTNTAAESS